MSVDGQGWYGHRGPCSAEESRSGGALRGVLLGAASVRSWMAASKVACRNTASRSRTFSSLWLMIWASGSGVDGGGHLQATISGRTTQLLQKHLGGKGPVFGGHRFLRCSGRAARRIVCNYLSIVWHSSQRSVLPEKLATIASIRSQDFSLEVRPKAALISSHQERASPCRSPSLHPPIAAPLQQPEAPHHRLPLVTPAIRSFRLRSRSLR